MESPEVKRLLQAILALCINKRGTTAVCCLSPVRSGDPGSVH